MTESRWPKKDDRIEKTVNVTKKILVVDNCKRHNALEFDRKVTVNVYSIYKQYCKLKYFSFEEIFKYSNI